VAQAPTTFPVRHGRYAFLKVLSGPGDGPVFLAALDGAKKPWAIKTLPLQGPGAVDLHALKAATKMLARMHSDHLVAVLASADVEADGGFVMEHVPGKSLAAICRQAEEYSLLLPPELGLILAHDVFAAAELFHGFEGGLQVHGNISRKTILVGYAGDVKLAGYRPGAHSLSGLAMHVSRDLKPVATILSDLPFERFPKELATLVPRLLEDSISPVEATAAVRAFLHDSKPSAEQRRMAATWLAGVFPGQRADEAQEEARLFAAGMQLLAPVSGRFVAKRAFMFGSATVLFGLLGGGALWMVNRQPGEPRLEAMVTARRAEVPQSAGQVFELSVQAAPSAQAASSPTPALAATAPTAPAAPTPDPMEDAKPMPGAPGAGPARRDPTGAPADRLLREAEAAFDSGRRIQAVNLGLQALNVGGGARAHLALGEYYRSMLRYQEALNHYRAAVEIEPENNLALAGVRLLEKKVSPFR